MGHGLASFLLLITLRNKSSRSHLWVEMEALLHLGGAAAPGTPSGPRRDVIFGSYYNQVLLKTKLAKAA